MTLKHMKILTLLAVLFPIFSIFVSPRAFQMLHPPKNSICAPLSVVRILRLVLGFV